MSDTTAQPATPAASDSGDPRMPRLRELEGFTAFMAEGWATPDRTPPVVPGAAQAAAAHRARLSAALPGRTIIVVGGWAPVRANDFFYDFRPNSDFFWLTGCAVEGAVLTLTPNGTAHDAMLHVPRPAYPGDPDFFADAAHGELWVGSAPDLGDWSAALEIEVGARRDYLDRAQRVDGAMITGAHDEQVVAVIGGERSDELGRVLSELRLVKDAWEIGELRGAVDATIGGFSSVTREIPTAMAGGGERWLQGTFDRHARTYGNQPGYSTIVGSGSNAPTLHWVRCDGPVRPDELVLLDMGVEARSFYTADVTRTLPTSGTFSPVQREVHDLVERAHRAGLDAVAPGRVFSEFHTAAMEVIATGLSDWGLIPVSVDEALSPEGQHHRRYLVCGVGHHLGLDCHDCAQASPTAYSSGTMEPGMVLTVEPGLYFHSFDETVPPELRGIGVRLEDDILVTTDGRDVLSDALPIDAAGIEEWMRAQ